MESSIAVFLMGQLEREQLPTICEGLSCGGSTAASLQRSPHMPVSICSYRWPVERAGLTALPRRWVCGPPAGHTFSAFWL